MKYEDVIVTLVSQSSFLNDACQSNNGANQVIRECTNFIKVLDKAISEADK